MTDHEKFTLFIIPRNKPLDAKGVEQTLKRNGKESDRPRSSIMERA